MRSLRVCALAALVLAMVAPVNAQSNCYVQKIYAPIAAGSVWFGVSVDVDGEWAAVGSRKTAGGAMDDGAVHVFRRARDHRWVVHQTLVEPQGASACRFGANVRIDGSMMVIAATFDDDAATNAGAVHFFALNSDTERWEWEAKVLPPDGGGVDERFGSALSLHGSSFAASTYSMQSSKVHVLHQIRPGLWTSEKTFLSPFNQPDDRFGECVEISENLLAIGASAYGNSSELFTWHGAVCTYKRSPPAGTWEPLAVLYGPDSDLGFGTSLALTSDTLAIGSVTEIPPLSDSYRVSVRLFDFDGVTGNLAETALFVSPQTCSSL